jgi:hypothetical protein
MKTRFRILLVLALFVPVLSPGADGPKPADPSAKKPLVDGDFSSQTVGQPPKGWKQAYPTGGGVIATDGKETFLRLASAQPANAGVLQDIDVPPKAKTVTVLGRMRGKPENEKVDKRAAVEVALRYKDAKDASISAAIVGSTNSPNWHTFKREFKIPPGTTKVEVCARSIFAVGTFDFSEVRVEFKE